MPAPARAVITNVTWIGTGSSNVDNAANWNPAAVPVDTNTAVFDSTRSGVNLTPTQGSSDFNVSAFLFSNAASPFTITVGNQALSFSGLGITGSNTDATINVTNTNNDTALTTQIAFTSGSATSSGAANITVTNSGTLSGGVSGSSLNTMDSQFIAAPTFSMGSGGVLTVRNSGTDSSIGHGANQTGETLAPQAQFSNTLVVGDGNNITVSNSGNYSGSNDLTGNNVGVVLGNQFLVGDAVDDAFVAGDHLDFTVSNSATNSGSSTGNTNVGVVGAAQAQFAGTVSVGNYAALSITNNATNATTTAIGAPTDVTANGYVYEQQLYVNSQFNGGDHLSLTVTNAGHDTGTGFGGRYTGFISTIGTAGSQALFHNSFTVGDSAAITVQNTGTASGNNTDLSIYAGGMNLDQLEFGGEFQAADDLDITVSNSGTSSETGVGGDGIGTVSFNQLHFSSATMGDNATIALTNSGNYSGSNSVNFNYAGVLGRHQLFASANVQAGDGFYLQVQNTGRHSGTGVGGSLIGSVDNQARFDGSLTVGDNAMISLTNSGTNSSANTLNKVGYVNVNQLRVSGAFAAGKNLNLSIRNTAANTGNADNFAGYVSGSQAVFEQAFTIDDNSVFTASNSGTIEGPQIILTQGFNVTSGKATIRAINSGTVISDISFSILGANVGGNAVIVLEDSSLVADTSLATFTIGGLEGDSTSTAQFHANLIINTDSTTTSDFAGVIRNFTATTSTLTKEGVGTQTLSGVNTYTGLTTVADGILILTKSLAGDVTVDSGATFSTGNTSGTSTVAGNLINHGTVLVGITRTLAVGNLDTTTTNGTLAFAAGKTASNLTTGHIDTGGAAANFSHQAIYINYASGVINTSVSSLIATGTGVATVPTADVTDNSFLYDFSVAQGTGGSNNNLYLVADTGSLADLAENGNNLQVSQVLINSLSTTSDPTIIDIQNSLANASTSEAYNNILASTLQTANNGAASSAQGFTSQALNLTGSQLATAATGATGLSSGDAVVQELHFWLQGFGQRANQLGESSVTGYDASTLGEAIGVDTRNFDKNDIVGLSIAYGQSHVYGNDINNTYTNVDSYQLTAYGNHAMQNDYFVTGMAAFGWNQNTNTRYDIGGISGLTANAEYNSWQGAARGEVGRNFRIKQRGNLILTPTLSADYLHYDAQSYTETGAGGASLRVSGADKNLLNLGIGSRLQWTLKTNSGLRLTPEVHANYKYDVLKGDKADTTASFVAGGTTFETRGLDLSNSTFNLGAGMQLYGKQNWDVTVQYDLTLRHNYTANSGILSAAYSF